VEEGVDDAEHAAYRYAEEACGEKEANLLGRAREDLLVVGALGRLLQGYRLIEGGLPDDEREEAGQKTGEQPGGQAAAQVGRDHGLV
jgi:hypothetical protein